MYATYEGASCLCCNVIIFLSASERNVIFHSNNYNNKVFESKILRGLKSDTKIF